MWPFSKEEYNVKRDNILLPQTFISHISPDQKGFEIKYRCMNYDDDDESVIL